MIINCITLFIRIRNLRKTTILWPYNSVKRSLTSAPGKINFYSWRTALRKLPLKTNPWKKWIMISSKPIKADWENSPLCTKVYLRLSPWPLLKKSKVLTRNTPTPTSETYRSTKRMAHQPHPFSMENPCNQRHLSTPPPLPNLSQ